MFIRIAKQTHSDTSCIRIHRPKSNRRPMADGGDRRNPASILDTLGEEIVRIVAPVSACMAIVVVLVSVLSSSPSPLSTIAFSNDPSPSSSIWDNLKGAFLYAVLFVVAITALTFLLVLLFYFRCTGFLKAYMAFSSLVVLSFLGGEVCLLLLSRFGVPIDAPTFLLLLFNFSAVGVVAIFSAKMPILVTQSYLVVIGVLVAYWFTLLPEWTTWALLVAMAVYDLGAVLLPGGPLRLLVELAISRDEEIPALVYEARPVQYNPTANGRMWRERRGSDANPGPGLGNPVPGEPLPETRLVVAEDEASRGSLASEITVPLIDRQAVRIEEGGVDGIGLGSSGAIKLGLGDFIFYSVLVGRAALYDFMTVYACYLAIIAGLGITLLLLAFYRKALPALPVSIALGTLFYFLTRVLLEVFVVQCSTKLVMF